MKDIPDNFLAQNINFIIKRRRTTLSALAKSFNINVATLHGYANGVVPKNFSSLIRICHDEEITLNDLFFIDLKHLHKEPSVQKEAEKTEEAGRTINLNIRFID